MSIVVNVLFALFVFVAYSLFLAMVLAELMVAVARATLAPIERWIKLAGEAYDRVVK